MRPPISLLFGGLFIVAALALGAPGCGLTEENLTCQRAGAHLVSCCPDFPIKEISCSGFGNTDRFQCLLSLTCDEIRDEELCERDDYFANVEATCAASDPDLGAPEADMGAPATDMSEPEADMSEPEADMSEPEADMEPDVADMN